MVNERYGGKFTSYGELHDWSINNLSDFWTLVWDFSRIKTFKTYGSILVPGEQMMDTKWFVGARLNFAEKALVA
ncbi:acetyl-coenzyme A synthetase N-terminal domain-containing protein [Chloroflexota bacterium]